MADYYWVNGQPCRSTPTVAFDLRGVLYGQSAFETMRSYQGKIRLLGAHLERLFHSARALDIPIPMDLPGLVGEIEQCFDSVSLPEAVIRLYLIAGSAESGLMGEWTSEPTRILHVSPAPTVPHDIRQAGVSCISVSVDSLPVGTIQSAKSTSYAGNLVAYRRAAAVGAFEALLVGAGDEVIDGATSSVIAVTGGHLVTTPSDSRRLPSITLEYVLDLAKAECNSVTRNTVTLDTLFSADEVLLVSTLKEVIASVKIDKFFVGQGKPGPLARLLQHKYLTCINGPGILPNNPT